MKKMIMCFLIILSSKTFAQELINYEQIRAAIINGKSIRLAVNFELCTPIIIDIKRKQSYGLGVFTSNDITIDTHGTIVASTSNLSLNQFSVYNRPTNQVTQYTITQDGLIHIEIHAFDPLTYTPITNGSMFECKVHESAKVHASDIA